MWSKGGRLRRFVFFRHSRSKNPINVLMDFGFAFNGWALLVLMEAIEPLVKKYVPKDWKMPGETKAPPASGKADTKDERG